MKELIKILGLLVAIVGIVMKVMEIKNPPRSPQVIVQIQQTIQQTLQNALQGCDYNKQCTIEQYVATIPAINDLKAITEITRNDMAAKEAGLQEIEKNLQIVQAEYAKLTRNYPTSPPERIKIRGTILSHRRQMGVLITAIERMKPLDQKYLSIVESVKKDLRREL